VWYLAHPVRADYLYSQTQNMSHTIKVLRVLLAHGVKAIAPWFTHCLIRAEGDSRSHEEGIRMDELIVPALGGVILAGHRLTNGMKRELESAGPGMLVHNLIGVPDIMLADFIKGLEHV